MRHGKSQITRVTGRLRVGFATLGDSTEMRFWSGTPLHMLQALQAEGLNILNLGPLQASLLGPYKAMGWLLSKLGLPESPAVFAKPVVDQSAGILARKIRETAPDLVFAPAGSSFAWNVPRGTPLVYASDATFRLIDGYHPHYRNLSRAARATMDRVEQDTIARADVLLYPSKWAARSAIDDYGADPARVHVIPWGANLTEPPDREMVLHPRAPGPLRLLFVGVDWVEKGAGVAVDTLAHLRANGIEAELVICGCKPPAPVEQPGLTIIPFLNKNDPDQRARFLKLYLDADLFILPTRADCYGIVFCEAAAYGLPSLAPATGGVPGAISDRETGLLLPVGATGEDYATAITPLLNDPGRLAQLQVNSRNAFETRLNWQAWGAQVSGLMRSL